MFGGTVELRWLADGITLRFRRWPWKSYAPVHRVAMPCGDEADRDAALRECEALLKQYRGARLRVVVGDRWVRYDLIRLGETVLKQDDLVALAKAHFREILRGNEADWPLRLARSGDQLLVCALDGRLFSALQTLAGTAGLSLRSVEPLMTGALDRCRKQLKDYSGWLLVDEPHFMLCAWLANGAMRSVRAHVCDEGADRSETASLLLQRQAALLSQAAGDIALLSTPGRQLRLPEPWRVARHFDLVGG